MNRDELLSQCLAAYDDEDRHANGIARVMDIATAAARHVVPPGPCMEAAPTLLPGSPVITCTLLAGHAGGHTNGVTSWRERLDVDRPGFRPSDGAARAEPLSTGESMHYWPTGGRGFACGTDAGFRTSDMDSVTCHYCKVAKW